MQLSSLTWRSMKKTMNIINYVSIGNVAEHFSMDYEELSYLIIEFHHYVSEVMSIHTEYMSTSWESKMRLYST